jgi:hypothetical protein
VIATLGRDQATAPGVTVVANAQTTVDIVLP